MYRGWKRSHLLWAAPRPVRLSSQQLPPEPRHPPANRAVIDPVAHPHDGPAKNGGIGRERRDHLLAQRPAQVPLDCLRGVSRPARAPASPLPAPGRASGPAARRIPWRSRASSGARPRFTTACTNRRKPLGAEPSASPMRRTFSVFGTRGDISTSAIAGVVWIAAATASISSPRSASSPEPSPSSNSASA